MNAIAPAIEKTDIAVSAKDSVLHFEEGLVGFPEAKNFVLKESESIAPFQLLESADSEELSFLVIDPTLVVPEYTSRVDQREWDSVGITEETKRLALAIVVIGNQPEQCTGNLQAPLLINYENMCGKQVILMDNDFSVRQRLVM